MAPELVKLGSDHALSSQNLAARGRRRSRLHAISVVVSVFLGLGGSFIDEGVIFAARKLKCDGGRPACHQCMKRNNPCDYMAPMKRRGGVRSRRQYDGSDSEGGSGDDHDDPSLETEPSVSPDVPTRPLARMTSAPENMQVMESLQLPAIGKREELSVLPPLPKSEPMLSSVHAHLNDPVQDHEMDRQFLPTFALPPVPQLHSSAPPVLPPIRSTEENMPPQPPGTSAPPPQAPTRKRSSATASAKGNRASSNYGPKVVACNHCRGA